MLQIAQQASQSGSQSTGRQTFRIPLSGTRSVAGESNSNHEAPLRANCSTRLCFQDRRKSLRGDLSFRYYHARCFYTAGALVSVAVLCNLSDGLIIGVDSAVTVSDANGIRKVFEEGEKLFQLSDKIGVATYGLGGLEGRSIGSFIHEFELANQEVDNLPIDEVVERLRAFFLTVYIRFAEQIFGTPFDQIPPEQKGTLGLIVGGFSPHAFLSEAWEIQIPIHSQPGSARQICGPGSFLVAWFATYDPIERYLLGFDRGLMVELSTFIEGLLGRALTQEEINAFAPIREKYGYRIMLDSMPIQAGIEYVRFLVQLVIQHYRFTSPHPVVGGRAKLGVVTYKEENFRILE